MMASKLFGFLVIAALSTGASASADSIYDSEQSVAEHPWADSRPAAQQNTSAGWQNYQPNVMPTGQSQISPDSNQKKQRTSKRTNTNLSWTLPPTWTPNNMTD